MKKMKLKEFMIEKWKKIKRTNPKWKFGISRQDIEITKIPLVVCQNFMKLSR